MGKRNENSDLKKIKLEKAATNVSAIQSEANASVSVFWGEVFIPDSDIPPPQKKVTFPAL